jgi:hypothetical protein
MSKTDMKMNINKLMYRSLCELIYIYTVKPAHAVTSIKQSPSFKGHLFLVPAYINSYEFNLF